MMTLIANEFKKLMSRKKTYIVVGVFAVLMLIMCYASYKQSESYRNFSEPASRKANIESRIKQINSDLEKPSVKDERKIEEKQELLSLNEELDSLQNEIQLQSSDWKEALQKKIDSGNKQIDEMKQQGYDKSEDIEGIRKDVITNKYLVDNNIKPKDRGKVNALDFIEGAIDSLGVIFLIIGVSLFASDMVSGEFTPPTMKVLLTQPVSRGKVLLSKFISVALTAIALIVGVELLAFVFMGLIFGFGNAMYPITVGTKYVLGAKDLSTGMTGVVGVFGSTLIIPEWKYMIYVLLLQVLFIIACTSFAFLASTLFKSSMASMASSILIAIAMTIIQNIPSFKKIIPYLLVTYGSFGNIITSNIIQSSQLLQLTPAFSCIALVVWTVVCYVISHIVFVKRDVLI